MLKPTGVPAALTEPITLTPKLPAVPLKQLLVGVTCTFPEVPPKLTVMFVVP